MKCEVWEIKELRGKQWHQIHSGTESEVRAEFQRMLLSPGKRKMVNSRGMKIAVISVASVDISYEIES